VHANNCWRKWKGDGWLSSAVSELEKWQSVQNKNIANGINFQRQFSRATETTETRGVFMPFPYHFPHIFPSPLYGHVYFWLCLLYLGCCLSIYSSLHTNAKEAGE